MIGFKFPSVSKLLIVGIKLSLNGFAKNLHFINFIISLNCFNQEALVKNIKIVIKETLLCYLCSTELFLDAFFLYVFIIRAF